MPEVLSCFQSIGVTKDWRPIFSPKFRQLLRIRFPINRRHQGLATLYSSQYSFPFLSTSFQSIGVTKDWRPDSTTSCHPPQMAGFQSIGVTKDWRPLEVTLGALSGALCFQSIGVTKDWRRGNGGLSMERPPEQFPINRRHQGLATP